MLWGLLALGFLALASSRRSSAPMIYDPSTGEKHEAPPTGPEAPPPGLLLPPGVVPPSSPAAPATVAPPAAVVVKPGDTLGELAAQHGVSLAALKAANPSLTDRAHRGGDLIQPGEKVAVPPAPTMIQQPAGASGNLPTITRPLARQGFSPDGAHKLALEVYAAVVKGPSPQARELVRRFQLLADLMPRDGVYGPRTAGALAYYLARPGVTVKAPLPHTKDKRIVPYAL